MDKALSWLSLPILATIACLALLPRLITPRDITRELSSPEARQMVKHVIGRDLPADVGRLRGMFHHGRGRSDMEHVFVAFQAGAESQAYILETFGCQRIRQFPNQQNTLEDLDPGFWAPGCAFRGDSGISLFDKDPLERLRHDTIDGMMTGTFRDDALHGYYLTCAPDSDTAYGILVFEDLDVVYLAATRRGGVSEGRSAHSHMAFLFAFDLLTCAQNRPAPFVFGKGSLIERRYDEAHGNTVLFFPALVSH